MQIGRVLSSSVSSGKAEFTLHANVGDFIYFVDDNKQVLCQITSLQQSPFQGFTGYFRILDKILKPPRPYADLILNNDVNVGILNIGVDRNNRGMCLNLNPFFRHVLIAGKTQTGKTHISIALAEEFIKYKVPHIIIDPQGEFANLKSAVVVENIETEDLLSYLQERKTVVVNLLGLPYLTKAHRIYDILSKLRNRKEEDYKQAGNEIKLLKIPPLLITIDEAEVFAPSNYAKVLDVNTEELMKDLAKRGSKLGIGLIAISQRPPFFDIDVRSQCNSAIIFKLDDGGSIQVISKLGYVSRFDIRLVRRLKRGECIITGDLTLKPIVVKVRDIETKRAKDVNFAKILGVEENHQTEKKPKLDNFEIKIGKEEESNLVDAPPFRRGYTPSNRTHHYGRPGKLGSTPEQEQEILRHLRRR